MRDAMVLAVIVGAALWVRSRKASPAAVVAEAAATVESTARVWLAGSSSPDVVLGADRGYGPLRSAWG